MTFERRRLHKLIDQLPDSRLQHLHNEVMKLLDASYVPTYLGLPLYDPTNPQHQKLLLEMAAKNEEKNKPKHLK